MGIFTGAYALFGTGSFLKMPGTVVIFVYVMPALKKKKPEPPV